MQRALVLAIVVAIGVAHASPRSTRVVLVDPDPELQRAMTTALQPWKLEVVVDGAPVDEATARARADAQHARFVVWRNGADLVVFDRERGDIQHRDVATGALDPVDAASAALSVKTLMRLPSPEDFDRPPPPATGGHVELRVQAGAAMRVVEHASARFVGVVMIKPVASLRLGVMADAGTGDDLKSANFGGTWTDWSLLAVASWTIEKGRFELEPWIAAGITRSHVTAAPVGMGMMADAVDERATLATIRGGGFIRARFARMWSIGVSVGLEGTPGTPTYTRPNNDQVLYEVPSLGVSIGAMVAADLGR